MKGSTKIKILFQEVGGVLLINGRDPSTPGIGGEGV